jgi:arylsulfatase A-like enzyme
MLKKTLFIWLAGFLSLFFVEACVRVTMNAPYSITVQIVTALLYSFAGCVSGLVFWFIMFSLRNIFPKIKRSYSYNYIFMSVFITSVLSISMFLYLFKTGEGLVSSSFIIKITLILFSIIVSFFPLYFYFRWNELKAKLFIAYFSILPSLCLISILVFSPRKSLLPNLLRITDLFHFITLIVFSIICCYLLSVLLPFFSRLIVAWKRHSLMRVGIIMLPFILVLLILTFPLIQKNKQNNTNEPKNTLETTPNIILITMDTVRADHLSCYGYQRLTTPNVDQLAREGVLYKNAYSTTSWTLPSHASIFTGMYPSKHGAHYNPKFINIAASYTDEKKQGCTLLELINQSISKLSEEKVTLAKILSEKGYRTAGIIGGPFTSSVFGLAQGFDYYNENFYNVEQDAGFYLVYQAIELIFPLKDVIVQYGYSSLKRLGSQLNEVAFEWLNENYKQPFFLFINYFDAHGPYLAPPPYDKYFQKIPKNIILRHSSPLDLSYTNAGYRLMNKVISGNYHLTPQEKNLLISQYDDEIRYLDHCLGLLFERLKALKVYDNTLLIVVSDHGEAFGEHDVLTHGRTLYEELLRIPMIIKYPATHPQRGIIEKRVSLVDIFPTILAFLDFPIPAGIDGEILPHSNHPIIAEWHMQWFDPDKYKRDLKAIYQGKEKFIWASNSLHEFYDLEQDPGETINLFKNSPQRAQRMEQSLKQWLSSFKPLAASDSKIKLNESDIDKLRALGYVN